MKPKTLKSKTKNASAPPCISHSSGAVSAGRAHNETQNHKNKNKQNNARAPCCISHFWGAASAGRVASAPGVSSSYSCFLFPLPGSVPTRIRDL